MSNEFVVSIRAGWQRLSWSVRLGWLAITAVFVLTYWDRLLWFVEHAKQDDHQHFFFVPPFAIFLLWYRREMLDSDLPSGFSFWSIPCFAVWGLMRWFHAYFYYPTVDGLSAIPFMTGITLALGGWRGLRWAWPSLLMMFFMFPLPGAIADLFRFRLQRIATVVSVFLIQTMGIPAVAQGNAIFLSEPPPLEVANVCSGLRMLMLFVTICVGASFVMQGPLWEKLVIIASSIPIAIISNVCRITATGMQREFYSTEYLDEHFHDLAGLAMMPLALFLAWTEITLLRKLFPEERLDEPLTLAVAGKPRNAPGA